MEKKIERINELAAKAKTDEGLTPEELTERDALRKDYIAHMKGQLDSHLHSLKIVDEDGNDITPEKLKASKAARKKAEEENIEE